MPEVDNRGTHAVEADVRHTAADLMRARGKSLLLVMVAVAISALAFGFLPFEPTVKRGLSLLVLIGVLWLTEALPLAVTALLVPIAALLLGLPGLTTTSAFAPFADPIIWLFFGGFALATALRAQHLDRKMAYFLLKLARGHLGVAVLAMIAATTFLSFGISNTATAAMMLPLALGVVGRLDGERARQTQTFVLLGIAYAASLGGMGTLVASPPNAIAGRAAGIDFVEWLQIGLPLVAVLVPVMVAILWLMLRPDLNRRIPLIEASIPWTLTRVLTIAVFGCTALGWVFGAAPLRAVGIASPDTFVAVTAVIVIVAFGLASWKKIVEHTDWGVLVLFGGGLALGSILDLSGASAVLGHELAAVLHGTSPWLMFACIATFMIVLSEFASNTAAAALMVPVFATIATSMGLPPETLIVLVALAASCGFALPVATPPNAIVFGTGLVTQREMMKNGLVLNVACVVVLVAWALLSM